MRQVNSPGGTSSDTLSSARTADSPRPNTLDTAVSPTESLAGVQPGTRESSVDLPQPDAPMRQVNSPGGTSSELWSSARTAEPPRPNTLDTPVSRTVPLVPDRGRGAAIGDRHGTHLPHHGYELIWDSPAAASTLLSGPRS